jgi:hypothetical protein
MLKNVVLMRKGLSSPHGKWIDTPNIESSRQERNGKRGEKPVFVKSKVVGNNFTVLCFKNHKHNFYCTCIQAAFPYCYPFPGS